MNCLPMIREYVPHCHSGVLAVQYSDLNLPGQNERSTSFITPLPALSCVKSFNFPMNVGGTIEVNTYMEATDLCDQIIVIAHMADDGGDRVTEMALNSAMDPHFVSGWLTLTMAVTGWPSKYDGYVSIDTVFLT